MPRIKQRCLDEIRQHVSIVDVVQPYTQLKKMGHEWRGLSPFNSEKTPSFYVDPTKNVFYCFSSGQGGDVFRFIQIKENLSFYEAVETLAHRFNITLEYEEGQGAPHVNASLSREIFEINDLAADFYHRAFLEQTREGLAMREYWTNSRKFPLELATEFRIGYAPLSAEELLKKLRAKNFTPQALRECGLFFANDDDVQARSLRPRFRGRLMIPIRDIQKRVVGFAARQTDLTPRDTRYEEGKYVNTPETPVFKKGALLFNLDRAKDGVKDTDAFLLVEGQLDALRCWNCGFRTVIAPQGTAITDTQLHALRNYTRRLECLLDGDVAGQRAALRVLPMALEAGLELTLLRLPEGEDPDELLQEKGAQALEALRKNALSPMMFAAQAHLPKDHPATPREKADAFDALSRLILLCDSEIVRQGYLREAARLLGIDSLTAARDFSLVRKAFERQQSFARPQNEPEQTQPPQLTSAEEDLLLITLNHDVLARTISQNTHSEWINKETMAGRLLDRILAALREGVIDDARQLDSLVESEQEREFLMNKYAQPNRFDQPEKAAALAFEAIQRSFYRAHREALENRMTKAANPDEQQKIFEAILETRRLIAAPQPLL